jgi:hypothetical protein
MALLGMAVAATVAAGGNREEIVGQTSNQGVRVEVEIEEGSAYLHRLKVLPLIRVQSPPQVAIWLETESGEFLETLYVTSRAGTNSWRSAPLDSTPAEEIRRPEALPVWSHRAKTAGEPDAMSSATPDSSYTVRSRLPANIDGVCIRLEVNHSTDFNDAFPRDVPPGAPGYSGGSWGSGQPSLIYGASLDAEEQSHTRELELLGHGSPAGEDGMIHREISGLTSALQILDGVRVRVASES